MKLRQAARLIGVSPGRLYRAIADGRLVSAPCGGPGKSTLVSQEALQAFCRSEGLRVREVADLTEHSEHAERSLDTQQELEGQRDRHGMSAPSPLFVVV